MTLSGTPGGGCQRRGLVRKGPTMNQRPRQTRLLWHKCVGAARPHDHGGRDPPRGARIELTVPPGFVILLIVLGSFGRVLRGLSYTPCEIQFARRFVCPPMSADDTAITAGATRGNTPEEGFSHGNRNSEVG